MIDRASTWSSLYSGPAGDAVRHDLGGIARAQVLDIGLEQLDKELSDAVVEEAELLVRSES